MVFGNKKYGKLRSEWRNTKEEAKASVAAASGIGSHDQYRGNSGKINSDKSMALSHEIDLKNLWGRLFFEGLGSDLDDFEKAVSRFHVDIVRNDEHSFPTRHAATAKKYHNEAGQKANRYMNSVQNDPTLKKFFHVQQGMLLSALFDIIQNLNFQMGKISEGKRKAGY